jgi:hypothetical protein
MSDGIFEVYKVRFFGTTHFGIALAVDFKFAVTSTRRLFEVTRAVGSVRIFRLLLGLTLNCSLS